MKLKIFHTADLHIGMKFNRYPEEIRTRLVKARTEVLENMIRVANDNTCQLFVIAGDLFENNRVNKSLVDEVMQILNRFEGEYVMVLPGNHDYDDSTAELWKRFAGGMGDKVVLLNQNRIYNLATMEQTINIYPAYCNQRHSDTNNIAWIKEQGLVDSQAINIGVAHGALEGTSPDLEGSYFFMSRRELEELPIDLWLLGHCHVRHPDLEVVHNNRIFNCGTPEPDGMNCCREGNAWLIEIGAGKEIEARSVKPGQFRFYDLEKAMTSEDDLLQLNHELLATEPGQSLVRLRLTGSIDEELLTQIPGYYEHWGEQLGYFNFDDSELHRRINRDIIAREFTQDSFPFSFLQKLADDPEALQVAYEIIRRVK